MKRKIKIPIWSGYPDGKPNRMIEVLDPPYAKNGWITPEGYFIEVPAGGHVRWRLTQLDRCGIIHYELDR